MNEPKFKVGDKVRVLDGSKIEGYTGEWAEDIMAQEIGEVHIITGMDCTRSRIGYNLDFRNTKYGTPFVWDGRGLELAEPENAPRFKAGDKVKETGLTETAFYGKILTIQTDRNIGGDTWYQVKENFNVWKEEWLELVPDKKSDLVKIVITTDGKTTLARLYEEKKVIKSAEAHCSPDDKFDFSVGAKLAMERLNKEAPAVTPKDNKIPEILDGYMVEFSKDGAYWSAIVYHNDRGDLCFSSEDWAPVDEFGKNGINTLNRKIKITKIYGRTNNRCASHNTPEDRALLWERK